MIELIAEISTNHGGSVPLAKEFIKRFADAGADWIKFQYTRVKHLRPDDPQYDWFKAAELSDDQFAELKAETEACGKKFLLTVYNAQDVPAVAKLSTEAIKVGSGEQGQADLLNAIRKVGWRRKFMSSDCCLDDWETLRYVAWYPALERFAIQIADRPYVFDDESYSTHVGWSDHVVGLDACQIAIMNGARLIEKHAQLPNQARPQKPFEATVQEFKGLRAFADQHPDRFIGRWQHNGV